MIEYDKLIRDRIPEIIEGAGKKCIVEVMDDNTYLESSSFSRTEQRYKINTALGKME